MKQRSLIKSQILKAWNNSITEDYCRQRINSERSLQASFWSKLDKLLPKSRRLFIEPTIVVNTGNGKKKIIPDIVVCNTKEIISVIELKYLPRAQPKYKKDVESLATIAENRGKISISNERYRGIEKDSLTYPLSRQVLFVWAGIHAKEKSDKRALYSEGFKRLEGCYMQLHAETTLESVSKVTVRK